MNSTNRPAFENVIYFTHPRESTNTLTSFSHNSDAVSSSKRCSSQTYESAQTNNLRAPRYTSYPTADRFSDSFTAQNFDWHLTNQPAQSNSSLGLYVHVPFCNSLCYYCACNKTVTRRRDKAQLFLDAIAIEAKLISQRSSNKQPITELHLGGGTPTWLSNDEIKKLVSILETNFPFSSTGERSIEIDPRSVDDATIECLAELDFNRMSIGVQDFDRRVQTAIHRIQPLSMTLEVMERARRTGFRSINLDLVYGLPFQTSSSFSKTVQQVVSLQPDRVALFNYAHLPAVFKSQRRIAESTLPSTQTRLEIAERARDEFEAAGYVPIGLDHFALPTDELAIAARTGRLHRNFQGYCTKASKDIVALGPSGISQVGGCYAQNAKNFENWRKLLSTGKLATVRGVELSRDDHIRRSIIQSLMCTGQIELSSLDTNWLIDSAVYFEKELRDLAKLQQKGFVVMEDDSIEVTEIGQKAALRTVASIFDKYLRESKDTSQYSTS